MLISYSSKISDLFSIICGPAIKYALITVKVLHTSLLNTTVVTFKVLPLGSYAPMPAPSPPFKTILKLVLWSGLQSCSCITPDVNNVIKMPSFKYKGFCPVLPRWRVRELNGPTTYSHHEAETCSWFAHSEGVFRLTDCVFSFLFV